MKENEQQPVVNSAEIRKKINVNETEATAWGPSIHWFRRARWKGDGPAFVKLNGAVFYPVVELDRFFNARLVKSTSEVSAREGKHHA